jgi:ABC-2 type transport system permease protein
MNWKHITAIALNDIKMSLRSPVSFALILFMPIIMVFVMGSVMKPAFDMAETQTISHFDVIYVNESTEGWAQAYDSFIRDSGADYFSLVEGSKGNVEDQMIAGDYPVAVLITSEVNNIQIIGSGKGPAEEMVLRTLTGSFLSSLNFSIALNESMLSDVSPNSPGRQYITEKTVDTLFSNITSYQYFASSMLVFFLLTSGMSIGTALIDDRTSKIHKRINAYPIKEKEYLLGKIVGSSTIGVIQAVLVIAVTTFVFGVDWGGKPVEVALIVTLLIFISSAVGILFSNFIKSSGALTASMTVVLWFMAFLSGGFTGTPISEAVSSLTINHWAFQSFTSVMTGGGFLDITIELAVLLIIAIMLWSIALMIYKRRVTNE